MSLAIGPAIAGDDLPFPSIGLLIVSGLACDDGGDINDFPSSTAQHFLTKSKFFELNLYGDQVTYKAIGYPSTPWLELGSELPGCGFSVAIQSKDLSESNEYLKRLRIHVGKIRNNGQVYYWAK